MDTIRLAECGNDREKDSNYHACSCVGWMLCGHASSMLFYPSKCSEI
jgi:hypothetical protein